MAKGELVAIIAFKSLPKNGFHFSKILKHLRSSLAQFEILDGQLVENH